MFNLFKKKQTTFPVTELVWLNNNSKKNGLLKLLKEKPSVLLVVWFNDTAADVEHFLRSNGLDTLVYTYRQVQSQQTGGKEIIFLEHYPLFKKEQDFFLSLNAAHITVLSALDEPLLKYFGGDRIANIMKAMGAGETAAVSHSMISHSLQKAQQKLEKDIMVEVEADSSSEWFSRNKKI